MNEITTDSITHVEESKAMRRIFNDKKHSLKLSQAQLARIFGCEPPTISNYLNGKMPINLKFALFFAEQLQVSLDQFSPRLDNEYKKLSTQTHIASGSIKPVGYPVLTHSDLDAFLNGQYHINDRMASPVFCSDKSFWLTIDTDLIDSKDDFLPNSLTILIDPSEKPKLNEYCLLDVTIDSNAFIKESTHNYLFRKIKHDGVNLVATAKNESTEPIKLIENENTHMIGKVVSAIYSPSIFNQS